MIRDMRYRKGDVIYRQGEKADEVFFVKYGTVHLHVDYKTELDRLIGLVTEGRVFGELGVIEDKPRSMTAVAGEETVVTVVDRESFPTFISEHPNKLIVVLESLSMRIRAQSHKLVRACRAVAEYAEQKESEGHVSRELMDEMKLLAAENRRARH